MNKNSTTYHVQLISGIPVGIPNEVSLQGSGFYVSYNNYDTGIYGCDTTALVTDDGQSNHFYVLNGDHRQNYKNIIQEGFNACLQYFNDNIQAINKYSERV